MKMERDDVKARYALRGQTVERSFGDAKGNRRLERFHGRGLSRARTESSSLKKKKPNLFNTASRILNLKALYPAERATEPSKMPAIENMLAVMKSKITYQPRFNCALLTGEAIYVLGGFFCLSCSLFCL